MGRPTLVSSASTFIYTLVLCLCLLLLSQTAYAASISTSTSAANSNPAHELSSGLYRRDAKVVVGANNQTRVFDEGTGTLIPQAPATDGSGKDFDIVAIMWLGFCGLVGVPLALAGVWLGRFATGAGCGLMGAIFAWTALANTMAPTPTNVNGVSDLIFAIVVFGTFLFTFCMGLFQFSRFVGIAFLCIVGGASIGVRISIMKAGLLLEKHGLDWTIMGVFALLGLLMLMRERLGVVVAAASAGSFLIGLAVDLALNKQSGMSRGIRFLLDRSANHFADFATTPYAPTNQSIIIIGASIGIIPVLAYAQHRIFSHPFYPTPTKRPGSMGTSSGDFTSDVETGLKQDGISNPEYYRRRGMTPPGGQGAQADDSESRFASWRASMGDRLQKMMNRS